MHIKNFSELPLQHPLDGYYCFKKKITNIGKDVENWGPLCIAGGNINSAAAVGNSTVVAQKIKHRVVTWSTNSSSGYMHKRTKSTDSNRYSSIIHNSQKIKITQTSINRWID